MMDAIRPTVILLTLSGVLVTALVGGCAASKQSYLTSYVDPAYYGRTFNSFVIRYDTTAIDLRKRVEDEVVGSFREAGLKAFAAGALNPPTRSWTDSAVAARVRSTGAQAELRISLEHLETRTHHVPGRTTTRNTTTVKSEQEVPRGSDSGETSRKRKKEKIESESKVTTESIVESRDPYSYTYDVRRIHLALVDLNSGDTIWVASEQQRGYFGHAAAWLAEAIIQQFRRDSLLARR